MFGSNYILHFRGRIVFLFLECCTSDCNLSGTPAEGEPLFVTPRDIDQRVRELSRMMAYGIDLALQPHLTVEDITGLLG